MVWGRNEARYLGRGGLPGYSVNVRWTLGKSCCIPGPQPLHHRNREQDQVSVPYCDLGGLSLAGGARDRVDRAVGLPSPDSKGTTFPFCFYFLWEKNSLPKIKIK